ncbi:unnamed protein product, partial [Rotaria magnacalcarata]
MVLVNNSSFSRGYPIFVSPLITSYSSTSKPINDIIGGELAWNLIKKNFSTFFQRAHGFFLSHCVGNASGTNEAIQLAERRTMSTVTATAHAQQSSFSVPATSTLSDQIRSLSIQQNMNTNNSGEMPVNNTVNNKKVVPSDQQTSVLVKRTSDSLVTTTITTTTTTTTTTTNDEPIRRRSSLSTEL